MASSGKAELLIVLNLVVGMGWDGEHSQRPVCDIVLVHAASTDQRQKWPQQGKAISHFRGSHGGVYNRPFWGGG